ncbi:MAG: C cytochrome precursor [Planctomycetes bacterium]|nr:C cytochrome precursor [Planctomycetota bacterium]
MMEWGLSAAMVLLILGLIPVIRSFGEARWRVTAIVSSAAVVFAIAAAALRSDSSDDAPLLALVPQQSVGGGFVSSESCRACHPGEYASWHATFHRTMTQLATPEAVQGPFDGVQLELEGRTYRLAREGDEFWVEMPDPDLETLLGSQGREQSSAVDVPTVRRRVVLTTGSHHLQDYWVASQDGKGLYHVPWEYHITEKRWIPFTDAHITPPDEQRGVIHWNSTCIACHSVGGIPGWDPPSDLWNTRVTEFGIACESCHGPGEEHVTHHRNPLNRYRQHFGNQPDPTIVNPAHESHEVSASICGQCHATFHMTDTSGTPDLPGYLMHGNRYRAGDDLADSVRMLSMQEPGTNLNGAFRRVYWNENDVRDAFWPDGSPRVGGREYLGLLDTPCYLRGEMSCLSCHSMHHSKPDGQIAALMDGNHACLQCHKSIGANVQAHTHHAAGSTGSECYNCHMPHTSFALLRAARSHRIDSPNVESGIRTGRPNACNLCHLDQTLQWSANRLSDWYGIETPPLDDEQQTVAASLIWLLRGDAAQRAITAWHMGWQPAQEASAPVGWQAPFLAVLLEDPYSVVRYVAGKSLISLPDFKNMDFDYVGSEEHRNQINRLVLDRWQESWSARLPDPNPRLLLKTNAEIDRERVRDLLRRRDNRAVRVKE